MADLADLPPPPDPWAAERTRASGEALVRVIDAARGTDFFVAAGARADTAARALFDGATVFLTERSGEAPRDLHERAARDAADKAAREALEAAANRARAPRQPA